MAFRSSYAWFFVMMLVTVVLFVVGVVVYALSGLDVRQRSGKAACAKGDLAQCVAVAKFYEERSFGLFGFFMSNNETALGYYDRACTLGSAPACMSAAKLVFHGADQARDSKFGDGDGVRFYQKACAAHLAAACYELGTLYIDPYRTPVDEKRAANAFEEGCDGGDGASCYQVGLFYQNGRGGYPADAGTALEIFNQTCDRSGYGSACAAVFVFKKTGQLP